MKSAAKPDSAFRNAKPEAKPYKLADSAGLYLLVKPNGSKLWQMKYKYAGKEKVFSIGNYKLTTLAEARESRDRAKKLLQQGVDPSEAKQETILGRFSELVRKLRDPEMGMTKVGGEGGDAPRP